MIAAGTTLQTRPRILVSPWFGDGPAHALALVAAAETVRRYVLHESIARGEWRRCTRRGSRARRLQPPRGRQAPAPGVHGGSGVRDDVSRRAKIASRIHHRMSSRCSTWSSPRAGDARPGVRARRPAERAHAPRAAIAEAHSHPISVAIAVGVLGASTQRTKRRDDLGTPLDVIHRDVSPQNVMLSTEASRVSWTSGSQRRGRAATRPALAW